MRTLPFLILLAGLGCASDPYRLPESDLGSGAPGQAFAAAGMLTRKPMPDRRQFQPWEFYFKHCALGDASRPWLSKTAYDCTSPR